MALLQELNLVLNAIGVLLTSTGGQIAGYDIYYADNPWQPDKTAYPWLDIMALDTEIKMDVTDSTEYVTQVTLRVYVKADVLGTGIPSLLASQDQLNDLREVVVDALIQDPRLIDTAIYAYPTRLSRLYLEDDERNASCFDCQMTVCYRRRP